jgi:hypothetical protein
MLLYLSVSLHVSAPMGHPQVNTMYYLYLKHPRESHCYHNGSAVPKFVSYYIEGKYELFTMDYLPTFGVLTYVHCIHLRMAHRGRNMLCYREI